MSSSGSSNNSSSSRETILAKLRAAKKPFDDAPARPASYLPVTVIEDTSPPALLERFTAELERVGGHVHPVTDDADATTCLLDLLRQHETNHILSWDFQYIPVAGLADALRDAGVRVEVPDLHAEGRADLAASIKQAGAGLIGADLVAATTGTLIVSTAPGKGRVPSVLPPVLIAMVTLDQLVPRIEDWVARQRASGLATMYSASNIAFITGASRTGDIEMQMVLGVHGPGVVHVIVKQ